MAIPEVIYTMPPRTKIVIQQEDADRLGLPRSTTAGAVQASVQVDVIEIEDTMDNTDPYTEL